jgi:hypothetical protein
VAITRFEQQLGEKFFLLAERCVTRYSLKNQPIGVTSLRSELTG